MKALNKEHIKFKFLYKSSHTYGWPLIKFYVDGYCYLNIEANKQEAEFSCNLSAGKHLIEILHYGKNYKTDAAKFFELKNVYINDIDIKDQLFEFTQLPDLPPWEVWHDGGAQVVWPNNLHLGHNGKLVYDNFSTPSVNWFKHHFNNVIVPRGMESSNETLDNIKEKFNVLRKT